MPDDLLQPENSAEFEALAASTHRYLVKFGLIETMRALLSMWDTSHKFDAEQVDARTTRTRSD